MSRQVTDITRQKNSAFTPGQPLAGSDDFRDSRRGLIEEVRDLQVRNAEGRVVWDMASYCAFLTPEAPCPDSVNPSLWRHEQLTSTAGLFEVCDGIWQVRGYDISNMTIIRSDTGYIIIDALTCVETAKAAIELFFRHFERKPVRGFVVTHSHADHFGGIAGVVDPSEIRSGRVRMVVPKKFMEESVSENIFVGSAMKRRALYQFGNQLVPGPMTNVGAGLGKATSTGFTCLIQPTDEIERTGQTLTIDGVDFVFQMTPETEAPAEMCVYLPQFRALCMAELVNSHLHNLLPLRGAKARSAFMWAQYLQEALHLFGDGTDVMFITHHWPCWGTAAVKDLLEKQRDLYKYINDQTVRAIRHGQTMVEIAEDLALPESLNSEWCSRGYYGSLNHNVKATYQWYLGWYDGVPANLNPLPPEEGGRKYVEFMGGPEETLRKARESYEKGEYRWAVTVLNHLVFSGLGGAEAEALLADTYEQLGWQAECATWRNSYLQGAKELREGPAHLPQRTASSASLENLPTDAVLAFLATTLDPARAAGVRLAVNISLTDTGETWCALLANSVLSCWPAADEGAAATCPMTRRTLDRLAAGELDAGAALAEGQVLEQGEAGALQALFAVFEEAPATGFNIVTP